MANTHHLIAGLNVSTVLRDLVCEMAEGTGFDDVHVWKTIRDLTTKFADQNANLLAERGRLQLEVNGWLTQRKGIPFNRHGFRDFLQKIGYLKFPDGRKKVRTQNVDPELRTAGPQLVNPIDSARFALNAANARHRSWWGALYESPDIIPTDNGCEITADAFNQKRGAAVIAYVNDRLDKYWPLKMGSHADVRRYYVKDDGTTLLADLDGGSVTTLTNSAQFVGYCGTTENPECIILLHHGLHLQLRFQRDDGITVEHKAGVQDVLLEAAITDIQDLEDATSAVGADAKANCYRNLWGLMAGDLSTSFQRENDGPQIARGLEPDMRYKTPTGEIGKLKGQALMLVRNVGIHKYTDAVTLEDGTPIPERILDLVMTVLASLHDLKKEEGAQRNSAHGSIYIVQPKLHGPDEVAYVVETFHAVEDAFGLPINTIKLGLMDEEMRTSVNLRECIHQALDRLFFINTGFLDRTGDMIATFMELGAISRTGDVKNSTWMAAYEACNVRVGLETGLHLVGQIGKGMWAQPNSMQEMLNQKIAHPRAGANTAWVPSPKAAVLHTEHYLEVDVAAVQQALLEEEEPDANLILEPSMLTRALTRDEIQHEIRTLAQGILGYVSRWVMLGIGCSRVPNLENVDLMEDLATLRIKSQLLANWLHHGIIYESDIHVVFSDMAGIVDGQNAETPGYVAMAGNLETNAAYRAALELVFQGRNLPRGYTTFVLNKWRAQMQAA